MTGTTGKTENLYSYDGFGNILESREGIQNRILYTGQQYDQETGQYYLRARYYNPVIGRFTQEDTYRGDGLNLYAYCDNNPVMYYDPSGHMQLGYGDDYNAAGNTGAAGINNNSNVNGIGQGVEGGSELIELSKNKMDHILKNHTFGRMQETINSLMDKGLQNTAQDLVDNKTFFNPTWSEQKVMDASTQAYNQVIAQGYTDGLHTVTVFGEEISVFLKDKVVHSIFGSHKFLLSDFGY